MTGVLLILSSVKSQYTYYCFCKVWENWLVDNLTSNLWRDSDSNPRRIAWPDLSSLSNLEYIVTVVLNSALSYTEHNQAYTMPAQPRATTLGRSNRPSEIQSWPE
jgi:hypothetical protein